MLLSFVVSLTYLTYVEENFRSPVVCQGTGYRSSYDLHS